MLPCEDGGRHQNRHLFSPHDRLEGCPQCDLGLADPDIAAQQPVHRPRVFHIPLDLPRGGQLVIGLLIGEPGFKIPLPVPVLREGKSLCRLPLCIEIQQLLGHLLGRLFDPGLRTRPIGPAELCQLDLFRAPCTG